MLSVVADIHVGCFNSIIVLLEHALHKPPAADGRMAFPSDFSHPDPVPFSLIQHFLNLRIDRKGLEFVAFSRLSGVETVSNVSHSSKDSASCKL